jgi:hypothetical protein
VDCPRNANRKVGSTGSDSSIHSTDGRFIARIVISKVLEIPANNIHFWN